MIDKNPDTSPAAAPGRCGSLEFPAAPSGIAARFLQVYQARNVLLGADLFHVPAWEILLLLETAQEGLAKEALRELINAPTLSLDRWLRVLLARGLVTESTCAGGAETYALTDKARADLAEVLRSALRKPSAP